MAVNPLSKFSNPWATGSFNENAVELNPVQTFSFHEAHSVPSPVFDNNKIVLGISSGEGTLALAAKPSISLECDFIYTADPALQGDLNSRYTAIHLAIEEFFKEQLSGLSLEEGQVINVTFTAFFSNSQAMLKEFGFNFNRWDNNAQQFQATIAMENRNRSRVVISKDKKRIFRHHGVKLIILQPSGISSAAKGGIIANLTVDDTARDLIKKVPAHEVCHLFGLSDRYQYLQTYTLDSNGCYTVNPFDSRNLMPIAVDMNVDDEYWTTGRPGLVDNIMFSKPNGYNLTKYQLSIIMGLADAEPDYPQVTILTDASSIPYNHTSRSDGRKYLVVQYDGTNLISWDDMAATTRIFDGTGSSIDSSTLGVYTPLRNNANIPLRTPDPNLTNPLGNAIFAGNNCDPAVITQNITNLTAPHQGLF